jgi:hypothetical protein
MFRMTQLYAKVMPLHNYPQVLELGGPWLHRAHSLRVPWDTVLFKT